MIRKKGTAMAAVPFFGIHVELKIKRGAQFAGSN